MGDPTPFNPTPVTLEGRFVRVEPLERRHAPGLAQAGADRSVWRWLAADPPNDAEQDVRERWFEAWIEDAILEQASGAGIPFAIVRLDESVAVGSTRYLSLRHEHRGLEIGWTWLGPGAQRTPVNTETKLLLLTHAFETLGALRIELKTDALNERSRRAIERIGASFEGVLRAHMIRPDGSLRDSAYYSILADEWPSTRDRLDRMLDRGPG